MIINTKSWLRSLLLLPALAGCTADLESGQAGVTDNDGVSIREAEIRCERPNKKHARFAVFSDPHFYDTALGTEGAAFQTYLASDRKMLVQSEPILNEVVGRILREHPDFVLVPGDLTKDGERQDHVRFAQYLRKIERAGIEVFVVPGNHDVQNPHAFQYTVDGAVPVANVDEKEFARIYREYGFGEALYRDTESLSYVAEPAPGVWLLAMDSTDHRDNTAETGPVTAGKFSPATKAWTLSMLAKAKKHDKRVIGMMHHGLLEHYTGQTILFPEYVINDHVALAKDLSMAGLEVVFTGHFHANDITVAHLDTGKHLADIETGSLVTAPSPFRFVDWDLPTQTMTVTTERVTSLPGQPDFSTWAAQFLDHGLKGLVVYQLTSTHLVDAVTAGFIAPVIATALEAHYAGDEPGADATTQQVAGLLQASGSAAGYAWGMSLLSLHADLAPADNNVVIHLGTGEASPTTP